MRENWNRASQTLEFTTDQLTKMIEPILPRRKVVASFYTQGGLANTNIRLKLSDTTTPLILRVFTRDPVQAEKEYRIYQRIAGLVPAPQVYFYSPSNDATGHPYLILQLIEGDRLETFVDALDSSWSPEVGRSVGSALAAIHSVTFPKEGFLDGALNVETPIGRGSKGFIEFCQSCIAQDVVELRLGGALSKEFLRFIELESPVLDQWNGAACLTHADFNGSNILVKRGARGWEVSAVLDWEFSLACSPFMDLGNLLRDPLGSVENFERSVKEGYIARGGNLPPDWRKMSKLVDMTAWLDFLSRPAVGDRLISDARSMIAKTMTEWYQTR